MAEIRPLIVAEPMLRAPKPEFVEESNRVSSAPSAVLAKLRKAKRIIIRICICLFLGRGGGEFEFSVINRNVRFRLLNDNLPFV